MAGRRPPILYTVLLLTLVATAWVALTESDASEEVVEVVTERASDPRRNAISNLTQDAASLSLRLNKLERAPITVGELNPFGSKSWFVAPPPLPVPPPPAPTAPPFPFTYQGKFEEDAGKWIIYLVKGDQFFAVKKGETFDMHYRIEGIENGNLVIEYLPLAVKQSIPIGSES